LADSTLEKTAVGWCRPHFQLSSNSGSYDSYGYDPVAKMAHGDGNGATSYAGAAPVWKPGVVVGCWITLNPADPSGPPPGNEMRYFVNGIDCGMAFANFYQGIAAGFLPYISTQSKDGVRFVFAEDE
jgi:hypothetical protein